MTDIKIIKESVNVQGISQEIQRIIKRFPGQNQISLQSNNPSPIPETDWNCSVGKFSDISGLELDYIHPIFPEAKLINHYLKEFDLYRSRIMINHSKECMTIHKDPSPRVHIPVISNENCLMIIDNYAHYLPPGKIYWTDTRKSHTAMNGSYEKRIHIVGCVTK